MSQSVLNILEEIESTTGTNAKRDILEAHANNELLKAVFLAAQDPYIVYYVNKFKAQKPLNTRLMEDDELVYMFLNELLPNLSSRKITGNLAKETVEEMFALMTALQQKWCGRILVHNLRCGVSTTINKVWPGLIRSFSVSLAATLKSEFVKGEGIKILEPVNYPVRVEPKLDGLRCVAIKKNGVVTLYTRNGTALDTLPRITEVLTRASYDDCVLDGEMLANGNWNDSVSVMMSSKRKKDDNDIVFNVFDAIQISEWESQDASMKYVDRIKLVTKCIDSVNSTRVCQVSHIIVNNEDELKTFFAECMEKGYEGVMLKTLDSAYKFDRSRNIIKLKPCITFEGVIYDQFAGRAGTKYEGLFAGFLVVLPNGVITRVGGGFNDELRAEVQMQDADHWIGKIVEIEAQPDPLTKDGLTKDGRARFPVFMRFRNESYVDPKVIEAFVDYVANNSK